MNSDLRFSAGDVRAGLTLRTSTTARVMRLKVDPRTGSVSLTVPRGVSRRKALDWAAGKRAWVESVLATVPAPVAIAPGGCIPLYDTPHSLEWSADWPRTIRLEEGRLIAGGPAEGLESRVLRWLKVHALEMLDRETREFAAEAGVSISRVGVGDPTSRWGSCSSSGAIRYSWRLILTPHWVRRATVAHEVAHRVHMNHGPQFHGLVDDLLGGDAKPARNWLRREGASLHRFGRSS